MADDQGVSFKLLRPIRVVVALGCGGLALAHLLFPSLLIDAVFLGLLIGAVVFLFYDVSKIGFGGLEASVTPRTLANLERRVERVVVGDRAAEAPRQPEVPPVEEAAPAMAPARAPTPLEELL